MGHFIVGLLGQYLFKNRQHLILAVTAIGVVGNEQIDRFAICIWQFYERIDKGQYVTRLVLGILVQDIFAQKAGTLLAFKFFAAYGTLYVVAIEAVVIFGLIVACQALERVYIVRVFCKHLVMYQ